jgi:hypothetical protein
MKVGWQRRPDNWPASLLLATALACLLPPFALLHANFNVLALVSALAALGLWCWIGRKTNGFPFLFDLVSLMLFLGLGVVAIIAVIRVMSLLLT